MTADEKAREVAAALSQSIRASRFGADANDITTLVKVQILLCVLFYVVFSHKA
jgi:hypothetical protein